MSSLYNWSGALEATGLAGTLFGRGGANGLGTDAEAATRHIQQITEIGAMLDIWELNARTSQSVAQRVAEAVRVGVDAAIAHQWALRGWAEGLVSTHITTDKAVRSAEAWQFASQQGARDPFNAGSGAPLAFDDVCAVPLSIDGYGGLIADPPRETPAATAGIVLYTSSSPALRLSSRLRGVAGNSVRVAVSNATTSGFKLTLARGASGGTYERVERYDNIDATSDGYAATVEDIARTSAFVDGIRVLAATRPDNLTTTNFTGGAGGAREDITARLARAIALPAVAAATQRVTLLRYYQTTYAKAWEPPPYKSLEAVSDVLRDRIGTTAGGRSFTVGSAVDTLREMIATAAVWAEARAFTR
jgi:hypothetical protein